MEGRGGEDLNSLQVAGRRPAQRFCMNFIFRARARVAAVTVLRVVMGGRQIGGREEREKEGRKGGREE